MTLRRIPVHAFSAAAALMLLARPAAAQNAVVNANFDSDITVWAVVIPPFGAGQWTGFDLNGSPMSGSLRFTNTSPNAAQALGGSQCVPASAGSSYSFGTWAWVPAFQTETGLAQAFVRWYPAAGCAGAQIATTSAPGVSAPQSWQLSTVPNALAPAGTASARFYVQVLKNEADGAFLAYFDRAFFGPPGTTPAELTGFTAE